MESAGIFVTLDTRQVERNMDKRRPRQHLVNPRINYLNPTALEVLDISGGEDCAAGASDRSNHSVELADSAPLSESRCSYLGVVAGGVLIETQHAPGKVVGKDGDRSALQSLPALPVW